MKSDTFDSLVRNEYLPMKSYALRLTHNLEDAEDLLHETMVRAIRYQDKFMEGTNFRGWLYTIMKNTFINNCKRANRSYIYYDETEKQQQLNSAASVAKNDGESRMVLKEINNAISRLSDNLRIPFMMSFTGYKYEEIAEQLHVPVGTVKIRIHCARKKLKTAVAYN